MKNLTYEKIVKKHKPKEEKLKNIIISFLTGGVIGLLANLIINIYVYLFHISTKDASGYMLITFIFIACFLTCLGVFDDIVNKTKMGSIIPITGFAHSVQSAMLDYKEEGFIYGFGANSFKLAGSVIIYGVISAFVFALIKLVFGV